MNIICKILLVITSCIFLSSCATINELQQGELAKTVGSFQLNPVAPNQYWYDGKSYEYNEYEIEIVSAPGNAKILWDGKYIGDTPFIYKYTGTLDKGDNIKVKAMPFDPTAMAQEASLRIREELPRKINFDLNKK